MSEEQTAAPAKAKKEPPVVTKVTMEDGTEVEFVGKRRMLKKSTVSEDGYSVTTRFDFIDGSTRSLTVSLDSSLALDFIGHGVEQKVGDETAGDDTVEDMVMHVENIIDRLSKGEWSAQRASGDGFSGASVVVKAICEALGWDVAKVKGWLEKKLADNPGLTRQKLYASFRAPGTKTAAIIARLEADKLSKSAAFDADAELAAMASE